MAVAGQLVDGSHERRPNASDGSRPVDSTASYWDLDRAKRCVSSGSTGASRATPSMIAKCGQAGPVGSTTR
ncbi:hypothetical protein O7621_23030 [Solwaraspora sp. WMMD937]|uniref:hypothetical protein n=1 Tax=Solwaraspora sp. WMMD937 TaxID=3016090 RepID=UPI00249B5C73|nr:hypothetical protein [Solwaraspora sp. WMMD937]WFE20726.1 hypothetical protein O7621_23030 [Solwaraspora sp. WMMD937]